MTPTDHGASTADIGDAGAGEAKRDWVRDRLLAWFDVNARDLPWRRTRDPYRVLVSEIMLQQTQVDRVIPHYERFLVAFPFVEALAAAPTAEVIRLWSGLGYNRRAVNLQRAARAVVDDHGGVFPDTVEALLALPGIGPYTAGAVACFAFERDGAFIDTNMRRVLHRLFLGPEGERTGTTERATLAVAAEIVPPGNGWTWNQALIEFGALHCTARRPACVICPLRERCEAAPTIQTSLATANVTGKAKAARAVPFEQTNRYARGRVVEALREATGTDGKDEGVRLRDLGPKVRPAFTDADVPWLYGVVEGLQRDGLAHVIREEGTAYDPAPAEGDAGNVLVRLP